MSIQPRNRRVETSVKLKPREIYPATKCGQPHSNIQELMVYEEALKEDRLREKARTVKAEVSQMFSEIEPDSRVPFLPAMPLGHVLDNCRKGLKGLDAVTTNIGMVSSKITDYLDMAAARAYA